MRYLITTNCHPPFFTDYYDSEKWTDNVEMVVYDLEENKYYSGVSWEDIEEDHL